MIELRNKQHATVIDCVAGEALEVGQVVKLVDNGDGQVKAMKATAATDADVQGTLVAWWINPRSTTITYKGGENGLDFPVAGSTDVDAQHYIPSGARMLAVGGPGVTEIRLFKESLSASFSASFPVPGAVLGVLAADSKFCPTGDVGVIASFTKAARVIEADAVSVTVILG